MRDERDMQENEQKRTREGGKQRVKRKKNAVLALVPCREEMYIKKGRERETDLLKGSHIE